jgi:hypothetical protein
MLVPGAGLNDSGKVVTVPKPNFLLHLPLLQAAFREHFARELGQGQVDPSVWRTAWGVHIQPFGSGAAAIKYLGTYVARGIIGDERIVSMDAGKVSFLWKDRSQGGCRKTMTLSGVEFVRRYLRHVLPKGLRAIRYYGFCHPAAVKNRTRIQLHTPEPVSLPEQPLPLPRRAPPRCPCCGEPMRPIRKLLPLYTRQASPRAPPISQVAA